MKFLARRTRLGLTLVTFLVLTGPALAFTTIDFEDPDLGSELYLLMDSYPAAGVTFTAPWDCDGDAMGLFKVTDTNQMLTTGVYRYIPRALHIRADFPAPPADPVSLVMVEVSTYPDTPVWLELFDADGFLIGSDTDTTVPACGSCDELFSGTIALAAIASGRVAYAVIRAGTPPAWQCGGGDCSPCAVGFGIDGFAFGDATTPARHANWGTVKALYR